MGHLWSDPRTLWVATMLLTGMVLACVGFVGWRREARERVEMDAAEAAPNRGIAGRVEIKTQRQPKGFSGIQDQLKKRAS